MPKQRTDRIDEVKRKLLIRLQHGFYRPGDRFMSNRAVANQYSISYQTAHRLIEELCHEGHLERRPQSGTYVPGTTKTWLGVDLIFARRAERAGSFGDKLLNELKQRLDQQHIEWRVRWADKTAAPATTRLPILWEAPEALTACANASQSAILIHDRPAQGLGALFIDSVSTDDRFGGACAADLLMAQTDQSTGFAVLAGPEDDPRNALRVEGFCAAVKSPVISAGGWYFEDGYAVAARAISKARHGLFCCNDRLAEAAIRWCADHDKPRPPIVGFDDAPIAESLNLTTIAIPWTELVDGVMQIVRKRLDGDRSASRRLIVHPRPIVRGF